MEYTHLISDSEVEILRSTLGRTVVFLHTQSLDVHSADVCGTFVVAPSFALDFGDGPQCLIESDWGDTPREHVDFHDIHVSSWDSPDRNDGNADVPCRGILGSACTVHLRLPLAPVARIEVLDARHSMGDESVHYDHGVLFTRSDGYRFSLSAYESIAGGLEFSEQEAHAEYLLEKCSQRLSLA